VYGSITAIGNLDLTTGSLTAQNLILSNTSTVTISKNNSIQLTGCATFNGKLVLSGRLTSPVVVITYSCHNGTFSEIDSGPCTNSTPYYQRNALLIEFSNLPNCTSSTSMSFENELLIIILCVVVGSIIIAVIAIFASPSLRHKLFPFRDRKFHVPNKIDEF